MPANPEIDQPVCTLDVFGVDDGQTEAISAARRRIRDTVRAASLPLSREALGDALLCASEIITNALVHAGGHCTVKLRWTGRHLRIEVNDASLRLPEVLPPSTERRSGRGIAVVDEFAFLWGFEPVGAGKTVFFMITADELQSPDRHLSTLVRAATGLAGRSAA